MATATRRRPARARADGPPCCPTPGIHLGRVSMDWSGHKVGELAPCRVCRAGAYCRDCTGTPCHKTCAEHELERDMALAERSPEA